MTDSERPPVSPGTMGIYRAVGWAAFAGAPILLVALATVSSRPNVPAAILPEAAGAALIASGLGFVAGVLHARHAPRAARMVAALDALVVIGFCSFLVWVSTQY